MENIMHLDPLFETIALELECPICLETCATPILMCVNGHNFCAHCAARLDMCSVCRKPGTPADRNLFAEKYLISVSLELERRFAKRKEIEDREYIPGQTVTPVKAKPQPGTSSAGPSNKSGTSNPAGGPNVSGQSNLAGTTSGRLNHSGTSTGRLNHSGTSNPAGGPNVSGQPNPTGVTSGRLNHSGTSNSLATPNVTERQHLDVRPNTSGGSGNGAQSRLSRDQPGSSRRGTQDECWNDEIPFIHGCTNCGWDHREGDCRAVNATCWKCDRKGHYARKCAESDGDEYDDTSSQVTAPERYQRWGDDCGCRRDGLPYCNHNPSGAGAYASYQPMALVPLGRANGYCCPNQPPPYMNNSSYQGAGNPGNGNYSGRPNYGGNVPYNQRRY